MGPGQHNRGLVVSWDDLTGDLSPTPQKPVNSYELEITIYHQGVALRRDRYFNGGSIPLPLPAEARD